jgi:hypothetical protein
VLSGGALGGPPGLHPGLQRGGNQPPAMVDARPKARARCAEQGERLRRLQVQGGGNAANALTAAARLGLSPVLLTKIGGDGLGDGIIRFVGASLPPFFVGASLPPFLWGRGRPCHHRRRSL